MDACQMLMSGEVDLAVCWMREGCVCVRVCVCVW